MLGRPAKIQGAHPEVKRAIPQADCASPSTATPMLGFGDPLRQVLRRIWWEMLMSKPPHQRQGAQESSYSPYQSFAADRRVGVTPSHPVADASDGGAVPAKPGLQGDGVIRRDVLSNAVTHARLARPIEGTSDDDQRDAAEPLPRRQLRARARRARRRRPSHYRRDPAGARRAPATQRAQPDPRPRPRRLSLVRR